MVVLTKGEIHAITCLSAYSERRVARILAHVSVQWTMMRLSIGRAVMMT
jgi:hypothetical protein